MTNYQIGDFLIQVKNASLANKKELEVKNSKYIKAVASILQKTGFLEKISEEKGKLKLSLAYKNKKPVMMNLKLVSRPGLRIYKGVEDLEKIKGFSIFIISTSKGIMTSLAAIKQRLGGEIIAEIW